MSNTRPLPQYQQGDHPQGGPHPMQGGPQQPMQGGPHPMQGGPQQPMQGGPHPNQRSHHRPSRGGDGSAARKSALVIHTAADIAAAFLGLWILLYLLEANQANVFVEFVRGMADWLAGWSQDIFTMETEGLRVFLNYGLPAVIYLLIGHGAAARLRRL